MDHPARRLALALLILGMPVGMAAAQGREPGPGGHEPPAPPIEALVAEALDRSPTIEALQARVAAARSMVAPAGALPDPMLEVMVQSVGAPWDPMRRMTMGQIGYTQPLPWLGKLQARREAATAEADVRESQADDVRRTVVMQVRSAYARLYMLDREFELLVAARELLDMLAAVAGSRYAAGLGDMEAIVKAQLEGSRLEARRSDLVAQRAAWVAAINRLLDRPAGATLGRVTSLPFPEITPEAVPDLALQRSPDVAMSTAAIRASKKRLAAAHLEARPNFLVGLGAGSTLDAATVVTLRFGIELPLWKAQKTDPMVAQARAELAEAEADLRATQARVRTDAERLLARWRRDQEQEVRYREAIVPQSSVAMDAARASYQAGRGDFSTVVENFRMWLDARVMMAEREAERFMTWAEIQMLTSSSAGLADAGGTP